MSYQLLKNLIVYGDYQGAKSLKLEIESLKANLSYHLEDESGENINLPYNTAWDIYKQIQDYFKLKPEENQSFYQKFPHKNREIGLMFNLINKNGKTQIDINYQKSPLKKLMLSRLGIPSTELKFLKNFLEKGGKGVILVSGEENSGVSTTLKALFKKANKEHFTSFALEKDSQENLNNCIQINLNQEKRQTELLLEDFKKHQPDIILIDEITSQKVLELALEYGQKETLVLAGFRAKSAIEALEKIKKQTSHKSMLANSLKIVTNQKLIPRLCPNCVERISVGNNVFRELKEIGQDQNINSDINIDLLNFYLSAGCLTCNNTGFIDKIGIFEILKINLKIKQQIQGNKKIIPNKTFKPLFQDALKKIHYGISSYDEIINLFL